MHRNAPDPRLKACDILPCTANEQSPLSLAVCLQATFSNSVGLRSIHRLNLIGASGDLPPTAAVPRVVLPETTPTALRLTFESTDALGVGGVNLRVVELDTGFVRAQALAGLPDPLIFTAVPPLAHWRNYTAQVRVRNRCGALSPWMASEPFRPDFTPPNGTDPRLFYFRPSTAEYVAGPPQSGLDSGWQAREEAALMRGQRGKASLSRGVGPVLRCQRHRPRDGAYCRVPFGRRLRGSCASLCLMVSEI